MFVGRGLHLAGTEGAGELAKPLGFDNAELAECGTNRHACLPVDP